MVLAQPFTTTSPTLVNYDFVDVLSDVGYVALYGFDDEASNKILKRLQLDSNSERRLYTATGADPEGEDNFDFIFNKPSRVNGSLFVSVTYFAIAGSTQSSDCKLNIRIIHYDGSTETVIGTSQTTELILQEADSSTIWKRTTLKFAVDKFFNKGDILRVEIEVASTFSVNSQVGFYHDGGNKNFGQVDPPVPSVSVGSNLIVNVPFDLDL